MKSNIINENNSNNVSVTVTPEIQPWVEQVRSHYQIISECTKQTEHWQKREFQSSLVCGEYLVKIRGTYGNSGRGFKKFIESEFANEFSYETCLRYMKLHNNRKNIPNDVVTIRKAYISLGIIKEDYLYPTTESIESESDTTSPTGCTPGNSDVPSPKFDIRFDKKDINSLKSIYFVVENGSSKENTYNEIMEFQFDENGHIVGRGLKRKPTFKPVVNTGIDRLLEKLKPFVEWCEAKQNNRNNSTELFGDSDRGSSFAE